MEERRQVAGWGERTRGLHERMTSLNRHHFFVITSVFAKISVFLNHYNI